jgi:hypothetical protein
MQATGCDAICILPRDAARLAAKGKQPPKREPNWCRARHNAHVHDDGRPVGEAGVDIDRFAKATMGLAIT